MKFGFDKIKFSKILLWILPTIFGMLIGIWKIIISYQTGMQIDLNIILSFLYTTLFGFCITCTVWAVTIQFAFWQNKSITMQHEYWDITMGKIPSDEIIKSQIGEKSKYLLLYLANERSKINKNFRLIINDGIWELSTVQLYEVICDSMKLAQKMKILDQDIRRWFELCVPCNEVSNSSTSFNYSKRFLEIVQKRVEIKKDTRFTIKRIFIINSILLPPTKDIMSSNVVKTLNAIWEEEDKYFIDKENNQGTAYLLSSELDNLQRDGVREYKDFVLLDSEICFNEDINYQFQGDSIPSHDTKGAIIINETKINNMECLFDELWKRAHKRYDLSKIKSLQQN